MANLFDDFPAEVRTAAVDRLLSRFPESDPIPLIEADGMRILELFHGKTGAFKDVALSMLPVFMKYSAGGKRVLILTATSGDTGSAAMQGFAGVDGTEVAVLFPNVGTSEVQRLQMTTPADKNVHAIAIRGNFDDAQTGVKNIFGDKEFAEILKKRGYTLSSANSINIGRLLPQVVYYYYAYFALVRNGNLKLGDKINFAVPTGNFGNILACYYAAKTGLPVNKIVCATNDNNVVSDFLNTVIRIIPLVFCMLVEIQENKIDLKQFLADYFDSYYFPCYGYFDFIKFGAFTV